MNEKREKGIAELIAEILTIKDSTSRELFIFALRAVLQIEHGERAGVQYLDDMDIKFLRRIFTVEIARAEFARQLKECKTYSGARQLIRDIFKQ